MAGKFTSNDYGMESFLKSMERKSWSKVSKKRWHNLVRDVVDLRKFDEKIISRIQAAKVMFNFDEKSLIFRIPEDNQIRKNIKLLDIALQSIRYGLTADCKNYGLKLGLENRYTVLKRIQKTIGCYWNPRYETDNDALDDSVRNKILPVVKSSTDTMDSAIHWFQIMTLNAKLLTDNYNSGLYEYRT